jgi:hypothetical protein
MKQWHLIINPKRQFNFSMQISSLMNYKTALIRTEAGERAQQKVEIKAYKAEALQA